MELLVSPSIAGAMSLLPLPATYPNRTWWHRGQPYSSIELLLDGLVHGIGLIIAVGVGATLMIAVASPIHIPTVAIYVGSLVAVLAISMAFNLAPITPVKRFLARLDQAAIFLLIAGTYTPLLTLLGDRSVADTMLATVWGAAIVGIALKLLVPERFGRVALLLYLGIGWSGIVVFQSLAATLPPSTLWLLLAGGVAYSSGIIFHVMERMNFHNVLWHCFVVLGASLHLWAVLDCMVLKG